MTVDEIIDSWNADAPISELDLGKSSREIPRLHAKYYSMYIDAKREIAKARYLFKKIRAQKYEFMINPTQEAMAEHGWVYPDRTILKSELKDYLEGDSELLKIEFKMNECELKADALQEILKQINNRNWLINNALKDRSFLHGE